MPSLGIAPHPGGCAGPAEMPAQDAAPVSGAFPAGAHSRLLEIRVQAIQLWPYHAGPVTRRPVHLGTAVTFLACYCPLPVSRPGQPSDPGTSLQVPPGWAGDTTGRLAAQPQHESVSRPGSCGEYDAPELPSIVVLHPPSN